MVYGAARLLAEAVELGYQAEIVQASDNNEFVVVHKYEVAVGRFAGRVIELGLLPTPDYPRNVGSSIHVKAVPQLLEIQNIANVRNITKSSLGPEWRYWSNNFQWTEERNARRLMAQINTIFENA